MRFVVPALSAVIVFVSTTTPAWAGVTTPTPGPLVGAGIPALLGLGYVYRRIRKSRGD